MAVALVMIAADEGDRPTRAIDSASSLCDHAYVLDTGVEEMEFGDAMPVTHVKAKWQGMADARTRALALARDHEWALMIDADMTASVHPELREWLLRGDPGVRDPGVVSWMVTIQDGKLEWRLPWLTKGGMDWRYKGVTHAVLERQGQQRNLRGLTITHHGPYNPRKPYQDIQALAAGVKADDPRSVYYTAWAMWAMGLVDAAADMFDRRGKMGGFEEERWHAVYMAARLRKDVEGLLEAHRQRPHRHEPLSWAGRFTAEKDHDDLLFMEQLDG